MQFELKDVSFSYQPDAKEPKYAVHHVSFSVEKGEFLAIIGHTGSGKSTLIQFLDGLLKPTSGKVFFNGTEITAKGYKYSNLRRSVGLVFQYPEHQLFETTVLKDVCYGPKNMGIDKEEQQARAIRALKAVRFPEDSYEKSPFDLSGGEKRRVAIAGVLAMEPECLILDEPTAGLDPHGREDILSMCRELQGSGITVILVSHSMDDVAEFAERILVMDSGELKYDGTPGEVFRHVDAWEGIGLSAPETVYLMRELKKRGYDVPEVVLNTEEAKEILLDLFRK